MLLQNVHLLLDYEISIVILTIKISIAARSEGQSRRDDNFYKIQGLAPPFHAIKIPCRFRVPILRLQQHRSECPRITARCDRCIEASREYVAELLNTSNRRECLLGITRLHLNARARK